MGGKSSTTTSTSGPPQQFLQAYTDTYNQARGLSNQPYQSYGGPMVAGFSPDQLAAFGTVQGSQGLAQPYYNQAAAYMQSAAQPVSPQGFNINGGDYSQFLPGVGLDYMTYAGQMSQQAAAPINTMAYNIDPYQNQYTNDVTDALSNTFAQNNAQQYNQIRGNSGTQGAFGTDREAIAEAQTAQQQDLAQQQTLAGVRQQGFAQAQQEFNTQQALDYQRQVAERQFAQGAGQLGLGIGQGMWGEFNTQQQQDLAAQEASAYLQAQAGTQLANLGTTAQGSALSGAQAQMGIGGMEQQLAQQQLNIPYYQFMQQQAYPYQQTGWLANISEGLGGASGGTGSTTYPGPSTLGQVAGLGTAGLGIYGLGNKAGWWGSGDSSADPWTGPVGASGGFYGGGGDYAADGGVVPHRAPGGSVGLGVPPEFGGAGVPGVDGGLESYIPGASGMGSKPASTSGGGLHQAFMQPVTSQTSGGGGGGLGSILGLGLSAAKLFLDDGGSVPGLAGGYANGGPTTHAAAPIVSDLSHVIAPNFLPKPDAEVIMPQRNFAPTFDAQGYPGTLQSVPRGAPVPPPLSIPMNNGMLNRGAFGAPPPSAGAPPQAFSPIGLVPNSNVGVPPIDMGGNLGGGGASGGHVGFGGIHYDGGGTVFDPDDPNDPRLLAASKFMAQRRAGLGQPPPVGPQIGNLLGQPGKYFPPQDALNGVTGQPINDYDSGGLVYPDMSKSYIPTLQAPARTMGPPAPPTNPAWKPDQGMTSSSVLDLLKGVKSSGLLNKTTEESMGGAVMPSAVPLQYDIGGTVPPGMSGVITGNPMAAQQQNAMVQRYQAVPIDKLRQLAMTHPATSPDGAAIQRALQMKQVAGAYPGGTGPAGPYGPQTGTMPGTTAANGGRMGLAAGGMYVSAGDTPEDDEGEYGGDYGGGNPIYSPSGDTAEEAMRRHGMSFTPNVQRYYPDSSHGDFGGGPQNMPGGGRGTVETLNEHMDPVERSLRYEPSYGEGERIPPKVSWGYYSDFNHEGDIQRRGLGREDDLVRALSRSRENQEESPVYPRVNGMGDLVTWPQGSMARGGLARGYDAGGDVVASAEIPPATYLVDDPGVAATPPEAKPVVAADVKPAGLASVPQVTSAPGGTNGIVPFAHPTTGTLSPPSLAYTPEEKAAVRRGNLMDIITSGEAQSYNSANRGVAGDTPEGTYNLTGMTVGDVMKEQARGLNAAGKPQIIPSTMRFLVDNGYLSPNDPYNEETQKKAFSALMGEKKRPDVQAYITGASDNLGAATTAVGKEWNAAATYPDAVAAGLRGARQVYQDAIKGGSSPADAWNAAMTSSVGEIPGKGGGGGGSPSAGLGSGVAVRPTSGEATPAGSAGASRPADDITSRMDALLKRLDERRSGGNDTYKSPWLPVLTAGLGMLASRSPFPGVAIGEGGLQGVKAMMQQAEAVPKNELEQTKSDAARLEMDLQNERMREQARSLSGASGSSVSTAPTAAASGASGASPTGQASVPVVGAGGNTVAPSSGGVGASPASPGETSTATPVISPVTGLTLPYNFGKAPAGSPEAQYDAGIAELEKQIYDVRRQSIFEPKRATENAATLANLIGHRIAAMDKDPRMVRARKEAEIAPDVEKARQTAIATLVPDIAKAILSNSGRPVVLRDGEVASTGATALGFDLPAMLRAYGINLGAPTGAAQPSASAAPGTAPGGGSTPAAGAVTGPTPGGAIGPVSAVPPPPALGPFKMPPNLPSNPNLSAPAWRQVPAQGGGVTLAPTIPGLGGYQKESQALASAAQKGLIDLSGAAAMLEDQHREIVSVSGDKNFFGTGPGVQFRKNLGGAFNTYADMVGLSKLKVGEQDIASLAAIEKATWSLGAALTHGLTARPALLEFTSSKQAVPSSDQPMFSAMLLSNTLRMQNLYQRDQHAFVIDQYQKGVDPALAASRFQQENGNGAAGAALAATYMDVARARPESDIGKNINRLLSLPPEVRERGVREFNERFGLLGKHQSDVFGINNWGGLILQLAGK